MVAKQSPGNSKGCDDSEVLLRAFQSISSLILITGLSGAGKSTAMQLLADSGYFAVDNLPVTLTQQFLINCAGSKERFAKTALLLDVDSKESRESLLDILRVLTPRPPSMKVIFLDAENRTILKRYSETRRPHPGFDPVKDKTLEDTIQRERSRLLPIKERADIVIETSHLNVHALKRELREFLLSLGTAGDRLMRVNFLSFGFKHGVPLDCDLVVDVRFLRNPYFVEELREQDGLSLQVSSYVFESSEASEFVEKYSQLLSFLLPKYQFEGKAYLNVGVGCTGGKHRSVAIAEALRVALNSTQYHVSVKHRDIAR